MGLVNQNIVDTAMFLDNQPEGQGSVFLETARLSEGFYSQLQRHPVPLEEAAVRSVANNSMALAFDYPHRAGMFAPISMSRRRDSPRHITIFPGGGSLARAR
jgi:hypothetical protein